MKPTAEYFLLAFIKLPWHVHNSTQAIRIKNNVKYYRSEGFVNEFGYVTSF